MPKRIKNQMLIPMLVIIIPSPRFCRPAFLQPPRLECRDLAHFLAQVYSLPLIHSVVSCVMSCRVLSGVCRYLTPHMYPTLIIPGHVSFFPTCPPLPLRIPYLPLLSACYSLFPPFLLSSPPSRISPTVDPAFLVRVGLSSVVKPECRPVPSDPAKMSDILDIPAENKCLGR